MTHLPTTWGGGAVLRRGRTARARCVAAAALLLLPTLLLLLPPAPGDAPGPGNASTPGEAPAPVDASSPVHAPTPSEAPASGDAPAPEDASTPGNALPAPREPLPALLQLNNLSSLVNEAEPLSFDERTTVREDEVLSSGEARVRERYMPGHARAHGELCAARGARLRLVVLVASAPGNARQRMGVRLTWGHAARRADVALGFVLGAPPAALRPALAAEDALYGDLIEGRHGDSYGNLTLKTLSMLEWFVTYCPRAARLLKSDDDMFINVDELLRFAEAPERRHATRTVWGKVWRAAPVVRKVSSKFFVPREEFPGEVYPAYANGPAYLVAGDAAGALLRAALGARWLRMEDALVTGVAAERAHVARVDAPSFMRGRRQAQDPCTLRATVAFHQVSYQDQFDLWRTLHDPKAKC